MAESILFIYSLVSVIFTHWSISLIRIGPYCAHCFAESFYFNLLWSCKTESSTHTASFALRPDSVHTVGITSWGDLNEFLTLIVAWGQCLAGMLPCLLVLSHFPLILKRNSEERVFAHWSPLLAIFSLCVCVLRGRAVTHPSGSENIHGRKISRYEVEVDLRFLFILVKAVPMKKAELISRGSHVLQGNLPGTHRIEISIRSML